MGQVCDGHPLLVNGVGELSHGHPLLVNRFGELSQVFVPVTDALVEPPCLYPLCRPGARDTVLFEEGGAPFRWLTQRDDGWGKFRRGGLVEHFLDVSHTSQTLERRWSPHLSIVCGDDRG